MMQDVKFPMRNGSPHFMMCKFLCNLVLIFHLQTPICGVDAIDCFQSPQWPEAA